MYRKNVVVIQRSPVSDTVAATSIASRGRVKHLLICLCALLLVACQPFEGATAEPTVIRITGVSAMQPALYALTAAFHQRHPQVQFDLTGGGSLVGEERVLAGQAELAASILVSSTVSITAAQPRRTSSFTRTPIGLDGLAVIVHQQNPVEDLTLAQLQALYSGRLLNWEEVGGQVAEVLLTTREESSGSQQLFVERIMGEERISLTAIVLPTDADVIDFVAANANAIGYVSRAYVVAALDQADPATPTGPDATPPIHLLALEGHQPTLQSIQDQSYPLIQPLYLVSRMRPKGWLQQFIDFTLSPAGQAIIARYHARVR